MTNFPLLSSWCVLETYSKKSAQHLFIAYALYFLSVKKHAIMKYYGQTNMKISKYAINIYSQQVKKLKLLVAGELKNMTTT